MFVGEDLVSINQEVCHVLCFMFVMFQFVR